MFYLRGPNTEEEYKLKIKDHVLVKTKLNIVKKTLYFNNSKMHVFSHF